MVLVSGVFLDPHLDEKSLYRWKEQLRHIVADCKTELQRKAALVRFGEMYWQPDAEVPEGGRYVRAPKPTFQAMMASYHAWSNQIGIKQLALARAQDEDRAEDAAKLKASGHLNIWIHSMEI